MPTIPASTGGAGRGNFTALKTITPLDQAALLSAHLENDPDKSWVRGARGKVLKVISHLLKDLPEEHFYKIVFMRRDLDEVVASQNKMLERRGEDNPIDDQATKDYYLRHLIQVKFLVRNRANMEILEVHYRQALDEPARFVRDVVRFLDRPIDSDAMVGVVDENLYRNRKEKLRGSN